MDTRTFLVIFAVIAALFGLGLTFIPDSFMGLYGLVFEPGGTLMARYNGAALLAIAVLYWTARDMPETSSALRGALVAGALYNLVGLVVIAMATFAGVVNWLGWTTIVLHLLLLGGFGYSLFGKR